MTKHSSGPWAFDNGGIFDADGHEVADVLGRPGSEEFKANARLIAAAPDLLAALGAFYQAGVVADPAIWKQSDAALAKALGRTLQQLAKARA